MKCRNLPEFMNYMKRFYTFLLQSCQPPWNSFKNLSQSAWKQFQIRKNIAISSKDSADIKISTPARKGKQIRIESTAYNMKGCSYVSVCMCVSVFVNVLQQYEHKIVINKCNQMAATSGKTPLWSRRRRLTTINSGNNINSKQQQRAITNTNNGACSNR